MKDRPPTLRAGRLRGSRRATPAAGVLAILLAVDAIGCGNTVPPTAISTASLTATSEASSAPSVSPARPAESSTVPPVDAGGLVLAADGGEPGLAVLDSNGRPRPLNSPRNRIRFLGAEPGGIVAVLTDDSVANGRITGATVSWSRDRRFESAAAAAVDPTGREIAVLGRRELASTQPLRIQIGAVRGGPVRSVVVAALHANGPPVWVAGGHVVLRALTDAGGDRFVVVDPKTGHSELVRLDAIDLFASGDGGTVGIVDDDGIRVVAAGDVESGAPGTRLRLGASADGLHVATAALDAQGQRIAFVLEDDDQRPIAIRVAAASSGWAAMQQIAVPRGARLVRLAWSG